MVEIEVVEHQTRLVFISTIVIPLSPPGTQCRKGHPRVAFLHLFHGGERAEPLRAQRPRDFEGLGPAGRCRSESPICHRESDGAPEVQRESVREISGYHLRRRHFSACSRLAVSHHRTRCQTSKGLTSQQARFLRSEFRLGQHSALAQIVELKQLRIQVCLSRRWRARLLHLEVNALRGVSCQVAGGHGLAIDVKTGTGAGDRRINVTMIRMYKSRQDALAMLLALPIRGLRSSRTRPSANHVNRRCCFKRAPPDCYANLLRHGTKTANLLLPDDCLVRVSRSPHPRARNITYFVCPAVSVTACVHSFFSRASHLLGNHEH